MPDAGMQIEIEEEVKLAFPRFDFSKTIADALKCVDDCETQGLRSIRVVLEETEGQKNRIAFYNKRMKSITLIARDLFDFPPVVRRFSFLLRAVFVDAVFHSIAHHIFARDELEEPNIEEHAETYCSAKFEIYATQYRVVRLLRKFVSLMRRLSGVKGSQNSA